MSPRRRVAMAIGLSAAMVVALAALLPRGYIANDDIGFTEYLRRNAFTPWISPILARALSLAYQQAPDLPWLGLYQYALLFVTGAVLIHTCTELIDRRPGLARKATWLGALVIGASHAIQVVGITWTGASIAALGTAVCAFIAHAQICQAAGQPVSRPRALIYGLLLASGFMLRPQGLYAMVVTLLPLLGWAAARFARGRHLPRPAALIALVAPLALVLAIQGRVPQRRDGELPEFDRFNDARGLINGHTSYERLDSRAPELVARAGWTPDEYRDFMNWLILDERDYPPEKLQRLIDTGGIPEAITLRWSYHQIRSIARDSAASVYLFLSAVAAGAVLAWLGAIERRRGLAFCLGYVGYLIAVPLWLAANQRFPQRLSLSLYAVAALGIFVYLARSLAERPADPEPPPPRRHALAGAIVVGAFLLGWAWHLAAWLRPAPPPHRDELQAFEDRVAARGGFVFVYLQAGLVDLDPLRARPRGYDCLQGGWGTFSTVWYETLQRLGVRRGADVLAAMVDNPDAYLLAPLGVRGSLEEWIRRKTGRPSVRLSVVDSADVHTDGRPDLYRLVTTPLAQGSDEWRRMARDEWEASEALPGPPSVSGLAFRRIALAAPYERYASPVRHSTARLSLEPIDGGVRGAVTGDTGDGCAVTSEELEGVIGHHAGVRVPVHGLRAARFELKLIDPENIVGVFVHAQSQTSRSIRWRWLLGAPAQQFGHAGPFTLVPGYSARRLELAVRTARPRDVRHLDIILAVKPGTRAGFELRGLEVAEP